MKKSAKVLLATGGVAFVLVVSILLTMVINGYTLAPEAGSSAPGEEAAAFDGREVTSESSIAGKNAAREYLPSSLPPPSFRFQDGPDGKNVVTLAVGDTFLGMKLVELRAFEGGPDTDLAADNIVAQFEGTVTLRGVLSLPAQEEILYIDSHFDVAEEYQSLLPYLVGDSKRVWFSLTNRDEALAMIGKGTFEGLECEITIMDFCLMSYPSEVANSATLVSCRVL